jgi:DNA-binding transcriptional MerR regulator
MNSFTISQLQQFSGINVHSIRAWEKRYDALKPNRSEGNTRHYNGNQLRRLLNIVGLMNSEYKISELCSMSDSQLYGLMNKQLEQKINGDEFLVSQMIVASLEFSESLFDKVFSRAALQYGVEGAYLKLIYPFLQRLGVMWAANRIVPAQEHFICNLIRQKLNSIIDLLPVNENSKTHWILFLPENEFHETGLLFANYLIRNDGHYCTYLGSNVPLDSIKEAVKQLKPTNLLFFLVSKDDDASDKEYALHMIKSFPSQNIFCAAAPGRLSGIKPYKNFSVLNSIVQLKSEIQKLSK